MDARTAAIVLLVVMVMLLKHNSRKRKLLLLLLPEKRRILSGNYVEHRSLSWYDRFVTCDDRFPEVRWQQQFRVPRWLFDDFCEHIGPYIEMSDTRFKSAVPAHKLLAAFFYYIAQGVPLTVLSEMFAVGKSKLSCAFKVILRSIVKEYNDVIFFPQSEHGLELLAKGFAASNHPPGIVAAIDCTHVHIRRPAGESGTDYYDRNNRFSVVAQVACDSFGQIVHCSVGWPEYLKHPGSKTALPALLCKAFVSEVTLDTLYFHHSSHRTQTPPFFRTHHHRTSVRHA